MRRPQRILDAGYRASEQQQGRHRAAPSHSGSKSDRAGGDAELGEGTGRRALFVQPAMRLGNLPAWGVSGQFTAHDAEAPLGRSVHTEQPMRERQMLGPSWRQALLVNALVR
jgi:hypothetical protein